MNKDTYSEYWNGIEASIAEILKWARDYCESAEEAKEYVYAQISVNMDLWERLPADWDSGIDELYAERSLSVA